MKVIHEKSDGPRLLEVGVGELFLYEEQTHLRLPDRNGWVQAIRLSDGDVISISRSHRVTVAREAELRVGY